MYRILVGKPEGKLEHSMKIRFEFGKVVAWTRLI